MNSHGVNPIFRENKDGVVYGLTLIDNKKGAVFNGRDLGKEYSGQALVKRFDALIAAARISGEKEKEESTDRDSERLQREGYHTFQPTWKLAIPKEILELMRAEKFYTEPINKHL